MKNLKSIFILSIAMLGILSCKKDAKDTPVTPEIYKPRLIESYAGSSIDIFDLHNVNSVKFHRYLWNITTHVFNFIQTIDTSTVGYSLKDFPKISDAVETGGYSVHIQDRSVDDKTFYFSAGLPTTTSTLTVDHPGIPVRWTKAKKTDAYVYLSEAYGEATNNYSYFYFDFDAGEYIFSRNSLFVDNYKITDLIKTPNGNMATDPIDWTLGDAAFSYYDDRYPNETAFVVLDYDAMKYVLFTRKTGNVGDVGRQTLRTTTWQPMSALFDIWKI